MATRVEDANRMIEGGEKASKILYIGFQSRYTAVYHKMHELAEAGRSAGPLIRTKFRADWNPDSWKVPDPRTGQLAIWWFLNSSTKVAACWKTASTRWTL